MPVTVLTIFVWKTPGTPDLFRWAFDGAEDPARFKRDPKTRTLLMELASAEDIITAMRGVNRCVTDLYRLFIEPYLDMGG